VRHVIRTLGKVEAEFVAYPMFDGFIRDEDVENLAGPLDSEQQIFRPVQLTRIPDKVEDFQGVVKVLRECEHQCVLLANQVRQVRSSEMHQVAVIGHVFTRVLPVPLSPTHPHLDKCMWRKAMRYETQLDVLRLVQHLSRLYTAAIMSLPLTRALDATRMLTVTAMAAIVDYVVRVCATDYPSMFSLHMEGTAPWTAAFEQHPFGLDVTAFVVASEDMLLLAPEHSTCRSNILEYFAGQRARIPDDHVMFPLENMGEVLGKGAAPQQHCCASGLLIRQLCWEMGFANDDHLLYVTGQRSDVVDLYPELEVYRDVTCMFKFMTLAAPGTLPDVKQWCAKDAKLTWKAADDRFVLRCFGQEVKLALPEGLAAPKKESFLANLFRSNRPRSSLRGGTDPSTICGEPIHSEEDVLHVKELPTFDGKLSQSSSELLVSFLTVPYIRIPLVINFFASPENINALSHPDMQRLLDSVMFEPGLWQPLGNIKIPEVIPAPDRSHLATNCGLLFNELLKSPQGIMDSMLNVLKLAMELDTGRWTHRSAAVILFVVRLMVRVEGFMLFLIHYNRRDKTRVNGTGWDSYVQGLDASKQDIDAMDDYRAKIREILNTQARSIIDRWVAYCIKKNEMGRVAFLYAHRYAKYVKRDL